MSIYSETNFPNSFMLFSIDVEHLQVDIFFEQFQIYSMSSKKSPLLWILFYNIFDLGLLQLIHMPSHESQGM